MTGSIAADQGRDHRPGSSVAPILSLQELWVRYQGDAPVQAVNGVTLSVGREKLGIVGESGSGKTSLGRAILRLLPANAHVGARRLDFQGLDLLRLPERRMRAIRGRQIAMIRQDPKASLNPVMPVGEQITETLLTHTDVERSDAYRLTLEMLTAVRFRDPTRIFGLYPHELSGGMAQRVMIAMMVILAPDLLIADEACSALDVTVQMQILAILDDLVRRRGMGLIFISHDLDLVASFCDRVAIMYAGRIVEICDAASLPAARHPYTRALWAATPRLGEQSDRLSVLGRDPTWLPPPTEQGQ